MPSRPNILFVLVDQLGARWLPTYSHPIVRKRHPTLYNFADDPRTRIIGLTILIVPRFKRLAGEFSQMS
ncbi:MAG: hypothetical protein OXG85_17280 [Chloroflexi bacterium]|nr:hypothetical protein [Chloroflexota bacterium]